MKAIELKFNLEHDHSNGHTMTLTWAHGISMHVELRPGGYISISKDNEVKSRHQVDETSLDDFIEMEYQCQEMDNQLARFKEQ